MLTISILMITERIIVIIVNNELSFLSLKIITIKRYYKKMKKIDFWRTVPNSHRTGLDLNLHGENF